MKRYLLALDEGTTSARAILFDRDLNVVSVAKHEFPQLYPAPGWVEQDPSALYAAEVSAMTECVAASGVDAQDIAAIGITNQRETVIVWDKATGKPVYNAIVWQCRRTAEDMKALADKGLADMIRRKTGLPLDAYFSASKIRWILRHADGAAEKAARGELLCGTVDTFLVWKLTGGKAFVTDRTNACRTMLYDLAADDWDDELLALFGVDRAMLPKVVSSSEPVGEVDLFGARVPICGMAGDQQAAMFGEGCYLDGEAKNTYGTGCFLLSHTGSAPVFSGNGLVTTVLATEKDKPREYALEGSVFIGGAVIQWLRDALHLITDAADTAYFASKCASAGGVYVVPAFVGLGAPYWDMDARGAVFGLTRGSGRNELIRASLESIAFQVNDLLTAMEKDRAKRISVLKADGGASANGFLMQFQSSVSDVKVIRPESPEATALGAAALAGLGCGFYASREEVAAKLAVGEEYAPAMDGETREKLLDGWRRAVRACRAFTT